MPKTDEAQKELAKRVGAIHAAAVLARLDKLSCPKEQKQKLLAEIKKSAT